MYIERDAHIEVIEKHKQSYTLPYVIFTQVAHSIPSQSAVKCITPTYS